MSVRDVMYDFGTWLRKKSYPNAKIEFYSAVEGLADWAPIVPASKVIPQWYRDLPKTHEPMHHRNAQSNHTKLLPTGNPVEWRTTGETIKTCPGMQDILTHGYVVPFWGAALIETSLDGTTAASITSSILSAYADGKDGADHLSLKNLNDDPSSSAEWLRYLYGIGFNVDEVRDWKHYQLNEVRNQWTLTTHPPHQYSTMVNDLPEEYSKAVIKVSSPWRIKTPPGMCTMVMPLPYRWNPFEVLPGIIQTDYYNTFNMFMVIKHKGAKINLQFKEPLCLFNIFPKHQLPYEVRDIDYNDNYQERVQTNAINANWGSSKGYRMLGKIFQKKSGGKCPFS